MLMCVCFFPPRLIQSQCSASWHDSVRGQQSTWKVSPWWDVQAAVASALPSGPPCKSQSKERCVLLLFLRFESVNRRALLFPNCCIKTFPAPLFFFLFLLFFFCLPLCLCLCTPALRWTNYMWSWISTEPFCRPCSAKSLPFEVLAVQTHHPHDHIISPKPDLCNTKWVPSQTYLYVRPQSHNRWYCVFELVVITEVSSEKKTPRWRLRLFFDTHLAAQHHNGYESRFSAFPPRATNE